LSFGLHLEQWSAMSLMSLRLLQSQLLAMLVGVLLVGVLLTIRMTMTMAWAVAQRKPLRLVFSRRLCATKVK
jgi:hypothetical protein